MMSNLQRVRRPIHEGNWKQSEDLKGCGCDRVEGYAAGRLKLRCCGSLLFCPVAHFPAESPMWRFRSPD